MSESFEEKVDLFLNFTGQIDSRIASLFIKGNNFDVPRAVDAYFENPDAARYEAQLQYDEASWSVDRSGEHPQSNALVPFQLDEANESAQLQPLGAPSRPPSRLSTQGQANRHNVEATAAQGAFGSQETGIVIEGQECVPDTKLEQRVRAEREPAFLKPLPQPDFLPPLITILSTIPSCWKNMLASHIVLPDYGFNKNWYSGEPIEMPRMIGENVETDRDSEIVYELQRLMAFLRFTRRSYGSVYPLSRCKYVEADLAHPMWHNEPQFLTFLASWENLSNTGLSNRSIVSMFSSKISNSSMTSWEETTVCYFDVRAADFAEHSKFSIYEALDSILWARDWQRSISSDAWIESIAPIILIRVTPAGQSSATPVMNIPLVWFADRYLASSANLVTQMREKVAENLAVLDEISQKRAKIETLPHSSSGSLKKVSSIFSDASKYLELRHSGAFEGEGAANWMGQNGQDVASSKDGMTLLLTRLDQVRTQLQSRIDALDVQEGSIRANIQELEGLLTQQTQGGDPQPRHRYHLRGITTLDSLNAQSTFIAQATPDDESLRDIGEEGTGKWWKMVYEATGSAATITKEVISEVECLESAGRLSVTTLLVYASDEMLSATADMELPKSLKAFIENDNAALAEEIESNNVA